MNFIVINGPNINFTGIREKSIYGQKNYDELCNYIKTWAIDNEVSCEIYQSNSEGSIIDMIQKSNDSYSGIVINPGAYSHYSIAIYDALKSINIPSIEVHMSNIFSRDEFRRNSVTAPACIGMICGLGFDSYIFSLKSLLNYWRNKND